MRPNDIRDLEYKAQECRYNIKVKVIASGETTVTLTKRQSTVSEAHVFEGKAPARATDGYAKALTIAVNRMVEYERRFE
jgi:hypothetical protein